MCISPGHTGYQRARRPNSAPGASRFPAPALPRFPAAINVVATWNSARVEQVGEGRCALTKYHGA